MGNVPGAGADSGDASVPDNMLDFGVDFREDVDRRVDVGRRDGVDGRDGVDFRKDVDPGDGDDLGDGVGAGDDVGLGDGGGLPNAAEDSGVCEVVSALQTADPDGIRFGQIFRATLDQAYHGQHTGRYRWEQLSKTEKTYFGTILEINLRREFDDVISDGARLDYRIAGHDVDCKFSQRFGGWMIPPEAFGQILLVTHVNDEAGEWAVGVVRASAEHCRTSANRDRKTQLNPAGNTATMWLHRPGILAPNVLLHCSDEDREAIFTAGSGQKRVNELFRRIQRRRIGRNVIATVAQQDDYMKRVRANGGARSALRPEGFLILGGDYHAQQELAGRLGVERPLRGELVSVRVTPAREGDPFSVEIDDVLWRAARDDEPAAGPAPSPPSMS